MLGRNIARFFSVLLQPLLMPLYSVALLFLYTNFYELYNKQVFGFLLPVFVSTFAIPALFIVIMRNMRYVRDYNLTERLDRTLPYLIFIISNVSLCYFFYSWQIFFWFLGLIIAPAIIGLVGMIINFFWKISAHLLGMGGLLGGILSVCFHVKGINPSGLFIILFVLAGILGVSRLYLKANTAAQVYVGFILGFVIAYFSVFAGFLIMSTGFRI